MSELIIDHLSDDYFEPKTQKRCVNHYNEWLLQLFQTLLAKYLIKMCLFFILLVAMPIKAWVWAAILQHCVFSFTCS